MSKKTKKVTVNGKEVTVEKMKVAQISQFLFAIDSLPEVITDIMAGMNLDNITDADLLAKLPKMLAHATDDVINLVSVASGFTTEEVNEFDFEELIDVVTAVVEINNIQVIMDKLKNLKQVFQEAKA